MNSPAFQLLLKIDDVARSLSISRRTLERMIAASGFPSADKRIGRMPRWRPETVDAWINRKDGGR